VYRGSPSIADRMRTLAIMSDIRKADDQGTGQLASMPGQVTPPAPPSPPPAAGPSPADMNALMQSGKVYGSSKEALADVEQRLTDLATDLTAHIGTIGQSRYTEDLDGETVLGHAQSLMALRQRVEDLRNMCEVIRLRDAPMVQHMPGMEMGGGGMPGMPGPGSLSNMPAPGPAGMPPGGMPMPGPMMGGM